MNKMSPCLFMFDKKKKISGRKVKKMCEILNNY